jgi:hypothetical protein
VSATLSGLDPATYDAHRLHAGTRHWPETNCYVDLWIEVLHSLELEPTAAHAVTLGLDHEGDQFTFFKFPLPELQFLYGIEVRELNLWRSLLPHAAEQVALGRLFIMDVDAYFLPDTAGVSYRREHVKSAIAVQHVDMPAQVLGYFHGTGYHALSGRDFQGVLRLGDAGERAALPPYAEIAKLDRVEHLPERELARRSLVLLRRHLALRPRDNPVRAYRERLQGDVAWLHAEPAEVFHQYAFATLRQLGSCFGLTSSYLQWLATQGEDGLEAAILATDEIASNAKALQFMLARAVRTAETDKLAHLFDRLEGNWQTAMGELEHRYGS